MAEPITFQVIFQFLQTVSIMAGIIYYFIVLNNQQKNQKITVMYDIFEAFRDEKTYSKWLELLRLEWDTVDDFWEIANDVEWNAKAHTMFHYYDGMGLLWKKKLLDLDDFSPLMGESCLKMWRKYKPVVEDIRLTHAPDYLCYWEMLCEALEPMVKEKWNKTGKPYNR